MKKKIYITTFRKGESQGEVLPIGVYFMDVTAKVEQYSSMGWGCFSMELKEKELLTVNILGHRYVVDTKKDYDREDFDYKVSIPWDLTQELKTTKCPHCNCFFL